MDYIFVRGCVDATVLVTPTTAIAAGDVVIAEDAVRFAKRDIAVGETGSLAASGGVYEGPKTSAVITDGQDLYVTPGGQLSTTASGNTKVGTAVGDYTAGDDRAQFVHI